MGEKLIELVCKCEELNDMLNKFSDSVWKEELWGRICKEVKSEFQCVFYCAF